MALYDPFNINKKPLEQTYGRQASPTVGSSYKGMTKNSFMGLLNRMRTSQMDSARTQYPSLPGRAQPQPYPSLPTDKPREYVFPEIGSYGGDFPMRGPVDFMPRERAMEDPFNSFTPPENNNYYFPFPTRNYGDAYGGLRGNTGYFSSILEALLGARNKRAALPNLYSFNNGGYRTPLSQRPIYAKDPTFIDANGIEQPNYQYYPA